MATERDELLLTHAGKLEQLQMTIETADEATAIHSSEIKQLEQIEDLKQELARLREVKDNLKKQLSLEPQKQMSDNIAFETKARASALPTHAVDPLQTKNKIWGDKRKRKVEDLQVSHRLTGRTIFRLAHGRYGIRFDTYFEGEFCDTFYAVLAKDPLDDTKMIVYKHTIPYFVPLKRIEARFLNKNIKLFSDCVHDYLRAFSARRAMVLKLKQIDPTISDLVTSDGFDYVTFRKPYKGYDLEVRLFYESVRDTLPVRCSVFADDDGRKKRAEKAEKHFLEYPLHVAIRTAFRLGQKEQQ